MANHEAHEFSVYVPDLSALLGRGAGSYTVTHADIVHRLAHVLRLHAGEVFVLFDRQVHARCVFEAATRRDVTFAVHAIEKNVVASPALTLVIGLLKKDALEMVVEHATQLGVNCVQPILTEKVQRPWGAHAEHERLERIIIAAASQSKNFALIDLRSPITFEEFAERTVTDESLKLVCCPDGQPLLNLLCEQPIGLRPVSVCVGPEGGFFEHELKRLLDVGYQPCRLTRTILRSTEAAALAAGIIRCA